MQKLSKHEINIDKALHIKWNFILVKSYILKTLQSD